MAEILANLSYDDYDARPGLRSSFLRDIVNRSPAHARFYADLPRRQTDAQKLGSALHCAVLEPSEYGRRYFVLPELDRRRKDDKAEYERLVAANPNKESLTLEQDARLRGMTAALTAHPLAHSLLFSMDGDAEQSIFWKRDLHECKARLDLALKSGVLVDLKSTANAKPEEFERSIFKYGYDVQAEWHTEAAVMCGLPAEEFYFVAVESEPPHGVCVYKLDIGARERAAEEIHRAFDIYCKCVKSNTWPAYSVEAQTVLCPAYLMDANTEDNF